MEKLEKLANEYKALHAAVIFSADMNHGEIRAVLNLRLEALIRDHFLSEAEAEALAVMLEKDGYNI